MKRKSFIIWFICVFLMNSLFSQENMERFSKYFDPEIENNEFLVNNPMLFYPTDYFPKLDDLKGKYFLRATQYYDMDEEGNKHYSDANTWITCFRYYKFNNLGVIESIFYICQNNLNKIEELEYSLYKYEKDKYIEHKTNLLTKEEEILEYSIREEKGKLFFERVDEYDSLYQIIFEKDKIINAELWDGVYNSKEEYIFKGDKVIFKYYTVEKYGKEEVNTELTYKKGTLQRIFSAFEGGQHEQDYFVNDKGIGKYTYKETRGKKVESFSHYLERQYNDAGFLEYEIERPLKDGEEGEYTIMNAKILEKPDELLKKYFTKELKRKR